MDDKNNKYGQFHSWEIVNDTIAIKHADQSFLEHHESGVPIPIRWFFNAEKMTITDRLKRELVFKGISYEAYIYGYRLGNKGSFSTKITFEKQLAEAIIKHSNTTTYPFVRFENIGNNTFQVSIYNQESLVDDTENEDIYYIESDYEGSKVTTLTTRSKRSAQNRLEAIKIHGTKCMVCGFDFGEVYGKLGEGYIEVHHKTPLSEYSDEEKVDPKTDLVCLCANCHRMLHRNKNEVISYEHLIDIIKGYEKKMKQ